MRITFSDICRGSVMAARWILFVGVLFWIVTLVAGENTGSGPVYTVFIQTENDADSILIVQQGAAALIDAGEPQDAPHILEVLEQYQVEKLDYFILTHYDQDHAGGAQEVLQSVPAERVIQPYYTPTEAVQELNLFLSQQKIPVHYPTHTMRLRCGEIQFLVYPPLEKNYSDKNNFSLAVLVQHDQVDMLFTGDALRKRCEELMQVDWPDIDLYKVPYHGRASSATPAMFALLQPQYAVVTSAAADEAVVQSAQDCGSTLLYTAAKDVVFISNGKQLQLDE